MIKYEGIEKTYKYNPEELNELINFVQNEKFNNYYNCTNNCTKEKATQLISMLETFLNNIEKVENPAILERKETEQEARDYFGEEFINQFNLIIDELDKQKAMLVIHGTEENTAAKICETGLKYKTPSLSSTACQQPMEYGAKKNNYNDFESLLNWGHKNYKGLVLLGIPYECYYKEPLWNHFQETDSSFYGGQDYKIDPDFIVGYIDVTNKKIIMNPKYNRNHNYDDYIFDNELYRANPNLTNELLSELLIEKEKEFADKDATASLMYETGKNDEIRFDGSNPYKYIEYATEELIGTLNAIKGNYTNSMKEEVYNYHFKTFTRTIKTFQAADPYLLSEEDARKKQEEMETKYSMFNTQDDDFAKSLDNNDWEDDIDWELPEENEVRRFR